MKEIPTYESFVELMEAFVLPRLHAVPGQTRLRQDAAMGKKAWGRQARFWFDGDLWNVYLRPSFCALGQGPDRGRRISGHVGTFSDSLEGNLCSCRYPSQPQSLACGERHALQRGRR